MLFTGLLKDKIYLKKKTTLRRQERDFLINTMIVQYW